MTPLNLLGLDLPVPVRAELSDEGLRVFRHRIPGLARNLGVGAHTNFVEVLLDGETVWRVYHRSFWRLAE